MHGAVNKLGTVNAIEVVNMPEAIYVLEADIRGPPLPVSHCVSLGPG